MLPFLDPSIEGNDKPDLFALQIIKSAMDDADGRCTALSADDDREQVIEKAQRFLCRLGPHKHNEPEQCSLCWFDLLCELIRMDSKFVAEYFRKRYMK